MSFNSSRFSCLNYFVLLNFPRDNPINDKISLKFTENTLDHNNVIFKVSHRHGITNLLIHA